MSLKREAPTDLNHENWDREDDTEREEMGSFKTASKEVLEKRVIRTAKRRSQISSNEPKKSVFSRFDGFNKIQQSSFDFLANLTNGSKNNSVQPTTKNDTVVSSSIFMNKSLSSSPSTGIFSMSGPSGFGTKSSEGFSFGGFAASTTSQVQSVFTTTKADSTVNDSPFKLQPSPGAVSVPKPNVNPDVSTSQVSSTIFGVPSDSSPKKSFFPCTTTTTSSLLSTPAVSSTSTSTMNSAPTKMESNTVESELKAKQKEDRKNTYFTKLTGLNESVSDWIKKHVEQTPLCILSPIFRDYEKYLKEIQAEYHGNETCTKSKENNTDSKDPPEKQGSPASKSVNPSIFGDIPSSNVGKMESPKNIESNISTKSSSSSFGVNTSTTTTANTDFSFKLKPSTPSTASSLCSVNSSTTTNANAGFSFGFQSSSPSTTTGFCSINPSTTTNANTGFSFNFKPSTPNAASSLSSVNSSPITNSNTPFSFGINKSGFGFNATSSPKTEMSDIAKQEDDEPPKVEFTPVVEENSVFDIKCKIFIKKDGNFVDKGVGTLYIKKIEDTGKHQLLVRANTNLGSVLLNLILSSSIPTQRMGKNNVMLVCIPTPDAKPPPTPILIRVKTAEDADDLLSTLNKYKA